jgi:hypothetical protein
VMLHQPIAHHAKNQPLSSSVPTLDHA